MLEYLRSVFSSTEEEALSASPVASSGSGADMSAAPPSASSGSDGDLPTASPAGGAAEDTDVNITFGSFGISPASVSLPTDHPADATKQAKNVNAAFGRVKAGHDAVEVSNTSSHIRRIEHDQSS
jgi:hypothetical protein